MRSVMKTLLKNILFTTTLTITLICADGSASRSQTTELGQSFFSTDALAIEGQSGGEVQSQGCGFIAQTPNHVLDITTRIDYMRVSVQVGGGKPTLLVDGPDGMFCILADDESGVKPEISGVWLPGKYSIYVGDRQGSRHPFTLRISSKNNVGKF